VSLSLLVQLFDVKRMDMITHLFPRNNPFYFEHAGKGWLRSLWAMAHFRLSPNRLTQQKP
jgi:hypothetical protein